MTVEDTVPESGTHTLRYRSLRTEIWRMYWRAWRKKLWVIHVLLAVVAAWICSNNTLPSIAVWFFVWLPIVVVCLAAFPQIMFKPHERMLQLTPEGWSSTIGSKSGSMSWKAIRGVEESPEGLLIVSATGNAMVVPQRAFTDVSHRAAVVTDVKGWFVASRASG
jgi:hypothetical protein